MFSWMNPKLEVQKTGKFGEGVFAVKNIKKNEMLAIFGGYIITALDELKLPEDMNDYGVQIDDDFIIGPTKFSEVGDTDFFNHSCDPNAGFGGQIFLIAMRDIKKGEEITFDYAMVLHKSKNRKLYKLKCLCGSEKCRKIVSDNDWMNPEIQKKYAGFFQYYIQEKINLLNKK